MNGMEGHTLGDAAWHRQQRCSGDCNQGRSCNCQQQSEPVAGLFRTQSNTIECFYKGSLTPIDGNHFHKEFVDALPLGKTVPLYLAPPAQSESERDAARYRWLRVNSPCVILEDVMGVEAERHPQRELDAAIDAAME